MTPTDAQLIDEGVGFRAPVSRGGEREERGGGARWAGGPARYNCTIPFALSLAWAKATAAHGEKSTTVV